MPFCEACDRHWTPTSMRADGSCPTCSRVLPLVETSRPPAADEAGEPGVVGEAADVEGPSAPWHFKVMLLALAIYLAWRGVQGVGWLLQHL